MHIMYMNIMRYTRFGPYVEHVGLGHGVFDHKLPMLGWLDKIRSHLQFYIYMNFEFQQLYTV